MNFFEWEKYLKDLRENPAPEEEEYRWNGWTYKEAKDYLKSIDEWNDIKDQDGWTIIATAIYLKKKGEEENHVRNL